MRLRALVAGTTAAVALIVLAAPAAHAQSDRNAQVRRPGAPPPTVFVTRDESGRTRTRLIVQQRSYLDGGTEVLPGQRGFTNYIFGSPYYSPLDVLGPGKNFDRQPLPPPWELGGTARQFP